MFSKNVEKRRILLFLLLALLLNTSALLFAQQGPTILTADGVTDTYTLIIDKLAPGEKLPGPIEAPDLYECDENHADFGPHITQAFDSDLGKAVFVFHIHVTPDIDRCINFDRQRNEIKTYNKSPDDLLGFRSDTVTFRWKFKLDAGFQPSPRFTHIHQIKPVDGDAAGNPIISLTPRKGNPDRLELIHDDSAHVRTVLASADLSLFKGVWVEAYEKITYRGPSDPPDDLNGTYSITLTNLSSGAVLLSYSNDNIDMWRNGTTIVRPKWGIYRSLEFPDDLRDEQVRFDQFCLAKGADDCPQ